MEQLRSNTEKINNYLRHEAGVKVIEIYECEWVKEKKSNPEIIEFLKDNLFNFKSALSGKITKDIILKKIIDGKLFGLVQCDIEVPAHLKSYFSEMTPIFKNVEVGREHISSHMREYCVDNKLLAQTHTHWKLFWKRYITFNTITCLVPWSWTYCNRHPTDC